MRFILISFILIFQSSLAGQSLDHKQGEYLVQLPKGTNPRNAATEWRYFNGKTTRIEVIREVVPFMNVWLLRIDYNQINEYDFLSYLRRQKLILAAQFNHFIQFRKVPDDPRFDLQWQYINTGSMGGLQNADLDADLAWDIATGGLTPAGDTIVVCVIDDGIDIDHEDLAPNLWRNYAEIPGNSVDDDQNGYIDDYRGWDSYNDDDNINRGGSHGTSVAGIVGAKGNNGIGVSGINWNVQLMIVRGGGTEEQALAAYTYPYVFRKKYNDTNGEQGAFVVATNASWGVPKGKPEESPLWCNFYDSLGMAGIVSVAATDNANVNVDEVGDLPTGCSSDFLISVTNVNRTDTKVSGAGYGPVSIDLGAYGEEVYTTKGLNNYGTFNGTSGSAPQVAGAIGLMYSAPCSYLNSLALNDPPSAAYLVKQFILNGVTPIPSLDSITVTGGRLNLFNTMQLLVSNCTSCAAPTSLRTSELLDTSTLLVWIASDSTTQVDLRWRKTGNTDWYEETNVEVPFRLSNLSACTYYEAQVRGLCTDTITDYGKIYQFQTDGCCKTPENLRIKNTTQTSAEVEWDRVLAAKSYNFRYRIAGTGEWVNQNLQTTQINLTGLALCSDYEVQIQTVCDTGATPFSALVSFSTFGCGACLDNNYCPSFGDDASGEWIALVKLHTLINETGSDGGYGNYTEGPSTDLEPSKQYDLVLKSGYSSQNWDEYFRVWIDFNQDGVFSEEELAFDPITTTNDSLAGKITVPANAKEGSTRMRVGMEFTGFGNDNKPEACEQNIQFGEVEDYCINIVIGDTLCLSPQSVNASFITPNAATIRWDAFSGAENQVLEFRMKDSSNWINIPVDTNFYRISGLAECRSYQVRLLSFCGNTESLYSDTLSFSTTCPCRIPNNIDTINSTSTGITLFWDMVINAHSYIVLYKEEGSTDWIELLNDANQISITELNPCTSYDYQIRALCPGTSSNFSLENSFLTSCSSGTSTLHSGLAYINIFPNPFELELKLQFSLLESDEVKIELISVTGALLEEKNLGMLTPGMHQVLTPTGNLLPGIYFIRIGTEKGFVVRKIIRL